MRDCLRVDWSVPSGETQTIFITEGLEQNIVSGFVQYASGNPEFINVRFYLGNRQVGETIKVFEESPLHLTLLILIVLLSNARILPAILIQMYVRENLVLLQETLYDRKVYD